MRCDQGEMWIELPTEKDYCDYMGLPKGPGDKDSVVGIDSFVNSEIGPEGRTPYRGGPNPSSDGGRETVMYGYLGLPYVGAIYDTYLRRLLTCVSVNWVRLSPLGLTPRDCPVVPNCTYTVNHTVYISLMVHCFK